MKIAVLITCHNRKEKTLQCLDRLFKQDGIDENFKIEVFLVDDGCTDGTSTEVNRKFPVVNVINGTGNLYWNRGMHLAWETAASNKDYDFYLWLNDDTFLFENALVDLLTYKNNHTIISGNTKSEINQSFTYGGYKNNLPVIPNGTYQLCDYSNGNVLLISKLVFKKIGNLDPVFQHALGDFDYTLRAKKHGIDIVVVPNWVGYCEYHKNLPKWVSEKNIFVRFKFLYHPLSGCSPNEYFIYDIRHNGILLAIFHFISIHIKCIAPNLFKFFK
jgi:GT2 family glycosyltransferase